MPVSAIGGDAEEIRGRSVIVQCPMLSAVCDVRHIILIHIITGVIVQFELVDGGVGGSAQQQAPQLLVCETSKELHSYSELFLDGIEAEGGSGGVSGKEVEDAEEEEGVHPTYRSWQWEVFPESLMAAELDFLEGFIH